MAYTQSPIDQNGNPFDFYVTQLVTPEQVYTAFNKFGRIVQHELNKGYNPFEVEALIRYINEFRSAVIGKPTDEQASENVKEICTIYSAVIPSESVDKSMDRLIQLNGMNEACSFSITLKNTPFASQKSARRHTHHFNQGLIEKSQSEILKAATQGYNDWYQVHYQVRQDGAKQYTYARSNSAMEIIVSFVIR